MFFQQAGKRKKEKKPSSHIAESVRACSTRVSALFFRASAQMLHLVWFFCAQVGRGHSYLGEKGEKGEPAVIEPVSGSLQNGLTWDRSISAESLSA